MNFIDDIQINPSPFLVELANRRGNDVTNAKPQNHLFKCSSMYLIISLVLVHF
jgi:hypothetical protein